MPQTAPPARTAVILAAGRGSRLNDDASKPLTEVGGRPLIEWVARGALAGGVESLVVVTGYRADQLGGALLGDPELGPRTTLVHNDHWDDLANGYSLLVAQEAVRALGSHFVLMMSDHLFDPRTLERLREHETHPDNGLLAVDYKLDTIFDMDDATKVRTRAGVITAISKELTDYNCVDTGMFRLPVSVFDALQAAYDQRGDCTLSDGIRRLAEAGCMEGFDVGDAFWQDVDTPETLVHAEKLLGRALGHAPGATPGAVSLY